MTTIHTPGPWRQGFTLRTPQTAQWTREQWELNDLRERRTVFANFSGLDQGRSRVQLAVFRNEEDARLTSAAPELLAELKAAHRLLQLAMVAMDTGQKARFAAASEAAGLGLEGATRFHERSLVLAKATGVAS